MRLSCVLLLALAPVNAVDSQPQAANLRGIASIALSDEESAPVMGDGINFVEESRYGGGPHPNSCRQVTNSCSTSLNAPTHHKCCGNLTCQFDDVVNSQVGHWDGACVANGPVPVAPNTAGGRQGRTCRLKGEHCNDTSASQTTKCCNDSAQGGPYNLVCDANASIYPGAGTCVDATPSAPGKEGRGGGWGPPVNTCRQVTNSCSTSLNAPTHHKCCGNLTCQFDDVVNSQVGHWDGKCVVATAPSED